jgi:hypothetical protein
MGATTIWPDEQTLTQIRNPNKIDIHRSVATAPHCNREPLTID